MKLSHEEEIFLRHWIYDEVHFREGAGPAKRLQVAHKIPPASLAQIIAAALTEPGEQEAAADGPPPTESPIWPWPEDGCARRIEEARRLLGVPWRGRARQIAELSAAADQPRDLDV
jgi:hypothetical protein